MAVQQPLHARHWIGGEWIDSHIQCDSINPATGDVIGQYADGGESEAQQAIEAALDEFANSSWRHDRRLRGALYG